MTTTISGTTGVITSTIDLTTPLAVVDGGTGLSVFSPPMCYIITDSTDIVLAVAAVATQSNVGSTFSANIPANGIIRMASFSGQILNNAVVVAHRTFFGIRIGTTNYWFNVGNATPIAGTSGSLDTSTGANLAVTYNGQSVGLLDVSACGIPTGTQTVQLISGYVTAQTSLQGTVKQTRVFLEIIGV